MGKGQIIIEHVESACLKNNPLGDPYFREIPIYLPADYDSSSASYPSIYLLTGFSGRGIQLLNRESFSETLPEKFDRLIAAGVLEPAIVVMPDCFTYYGGSQFINSSATGEYETHLVKELVPYIDGNYRTRPEPAQRAVMGKSSGGYGAFVQSLRHPELFGVAASHSGDSAFEYCFIPDFPPAMIELEKFSGIAEFLSDFYAQPKKKPMSFLTINIVAMSACFSPNPNTTPHGFDLPFDLKTGELRDDVWQRWLAWDPVHMIDDLADNAKRVKYFIDCGTQDEHNLYAGARIFTDKLKRLGIEHIHEEFVDNHRSLNYRYDRSLEEISKWFRA